MTSTLARFKAVAPNYQAVNTLHDYTISWGGGRGGEETHHMPLKNVLIEVVKNR